MNRFRFTSVLLAVALAGASSLFAQQPPVSPRETVSATIDGNAVSIAYGRPHMKSPTNGEVRKIWGGLVPFGQVWRTGANEATKLTLAQPIVLGGAELAAGSYTLFTVPLADGTAKLVINKRTGQWGIPYIEADEKPNELARVDLKKSAVAQTVEQFTMAVEPGAAGGGVIKLMWENTQYSVAFTNKK